MKKVIALSWDKLFLSCSQFESQLATISYKTNILSSSFAADRANGTIGHHRNGYITKISSSEKFNFEEVCERFAYLKNLLVSGHDLIVLTSLEGQAAEAVRSLLKEQGLFVPVISTADNWSRAKLSISYNIYINYDWFEIMPVIITTPDFYLVKSAILLKICLSKVKQFLPTWQFAKN